MWDESYLSKREDSMVRMGDEPADEASDEGGATTGGVSVAGEEGRSVSGVGIRPEHTAGKARGEG